jgi:hypothetical protein
MPGVAPDTFFTARLCQPAREEITPGTDAGDFPQTCWGLDLMAMPLSWKIGAAVASLIVAMFAWNGLSQYLAARQADEITRDSARTAMLEAQQAKAQAQQHQARLAANLKQHREDLSNTYQQVDERARQYQAEQAIRLNRQQQEDLRVQATYRLDGSQQCEGGIVISHNGSSFAQVIGTDGQPIPCKGDTATEPLR